MELGVVVVAAAVMAVVFAITAIMAVFALTAKRRAAPSMPLIALRCIIAMQCAVLALGVLLPKSMLRAVAFEITGRWLVRAAALVGTILAALMLRRREPGALRWLLLQLFIGVVMATFLGELIFAAFFMM